MIGFSSGLLFMVKIIVIFVYSQNFSNNIYHFQTLTEMDMKDFNNMDDSSTSETNSNMNESPKQTDKILNIDQQKAIKSTDTSTNEKT